jgi:maltose O-acetyltransferase
VAGHDPRDIKLADIARSIHVEKYVWIGGNSTIIANMDYKIDRETILTIGEGAIVAAGAVVTKNVSPWTVVAGIPTKEIKKGQLTEHVKYL